MYFEPHQYDRTIDKLTQSELNDLIRELQLTTGKSELLGSRLGEKKMFPSGVKFFWYRNREKEFRKCYAQEDQLVFCKDIRNVNKKVQIDATVCRHLFTAKSLYMFRVSQHPSSEVLKTVTATSGIGHTTGTATSFQRGLLSPDQTTLEGSSCTNVMTYTRGSGYRF